MAREKEPRRWTPQGTPTESASARLFDPQTMPPADNHMAEYAVRKKQEMALDKALRGTTMPPEPMPSSLPSDASLPGHGDEPPTGFFAMSVAILWAVLAFACGFEAIVYFNSWIVSRNFQDALVSGVDLVLCFALGGIALTLWQRREWLPQRIAEAARAVALNPAVWVAVVLIILAPQIWSQKIAATSSTDEIAKAVLAGLKGTSLSQTVNAQPPDLFMKTQVVQDGFNNKPGRQPAVLYDGQFIKTGRHLRFFC
ncbi:MAG TPA: hypothetical protein VGR70_17270 [Stellaceae bacterium]|nr:hypothetical protein [Stellaceae bacterium]